MTQTVVIDTSVLLSSGYKSFSLFGDSNVVVPLAVVKEVEAMRKNPELGSAANGVLRFLEDRKDESKVRIEMNHKDQIPDGLQGYSGADIKVITVAHNLMKEGLDIVLATKNLTMKLTAALVDVPTINPYDEDAEGKYTKFISKTAVLEVSDEDLADMYEKGEIKTDADLPINTGVLLHSKTNGEHVAGIAKSQWRIKLAEDRISANKFHAKNDEQKIALNLLLDDEVKVLSLSGVPGSGKSFLALQAALELVKDPSTQYEKIYYIRPVNPVGGASQDLGYLPGTVGEKTEVWQGVIDDILSSCNKIEADKIKKDKLVEFLPIAYIRGRSLKNAIILIDECQNVEYSTIVTLLSRAGINSRVFMIFDLNQRDAKYFSKYDGVFRVVKKLLGKKIFGHTHMVKSERSEISDMVADLLD